MDTQHFPHFIRANYPVLKNETNELLIELGDEFKKYLEEKFANDMDKLKPIWDIEPKTVIMNQVKRSPFTMNGYHPALLIHFSDFVTKMKNEAVS
jgi:hypothetical protein